MVSAVSQNTADDALNSLDFEVTGVFESFSKDYDARTVRIALPAAQELLGTTEINCLVVPLKEAKDTDSVRAGFSNNSIRPCSKSRPGGN